MAPGAKVTEALKAGLYVCKGPSWAGSDATGTFELFEVPPNTYVFDLIVDVKTKFDATGSTLTIGDSDVDGYHLNTTAKPSIVGTKSTRSFGLTETGPAYAGGRFYTSDDECTISAVVTKGVAGSDLVTAGAIDFYLVYNNFADLL
jgi:hypothetical protein